MIEYIATFIIYVFSPIVAQLLGLSQFYSFLLKVGLSSLALAFFWKKFKLKFKISLLGLIAGVLIFLFWILLEGYYPKLGNGVGFQPESTFELIVRLISSIMIAPLVEELFTRGWLNRYLVAKDWKKVPINSFSQFSFWLTVLFFGLSHDRWLPGIIAGIILNLLLIRKKNLTDCIFAHAIANTLLSVYVLYFQAWQFW